MGPMTGRGAGYCNGFAASGYAKPVGFMGGFGGGFGRGGGFRRMFYASMARKLIYMKIHI